jgi:hypothetical protein
MLDTVSYTNDDLSANHSSTLAVTGNTQSQTVQKTAKKVKFKFIYKKLFRSDSNQETNIDYSLTTSTTTAKQSNIEKRDEWTNKIEYMLSVIGYVVDLGNCVRFPYITYKNGGGAFLIPYFIFLFLIGTPMMYLEMSVGQYFRSGNITLWSKMNPYMKGKLK